jgi:hypothetical protein
MALEIMYKPSDILYLVPCEMMPTWIRLTRNILLIFSWDFMVCIFQSMSKSKSKVT